MKKTIKLVSSLALALALVLAAVGCGVAYADMNRRGDNVPLTSTPVEVAAPAPSDSITADEAATIAKEAAGLADTTDIRVERDDGKYEVTLRDGSIEYDVDVRIADGSVTEIDRDREKRRDDTSPSVAKPSSPPVSDKPASSSAISVDEAKSIAQKAAGLTDATDIRVERDDGKYEVTLRDGNVEYDVDVRIADGSVTEIDRDREDDHFGDWDDDRDDRYDDDWDDRYDWDD